MIEVEFYYNGAKTIIQCKLNDKIKDIYQEYLNKINEDRNSIYFSYNGNTENNFSEELTLQEMMNLEDEKRNKMNILVFNNEIKPEEKDIIKSKEIICPECGESIRFEIINYKIKLSECKNGHTIDNILLKEFEKTQFINNKEIKCEICEKCNIINKSNSYNKTFYKCLKCEKNICPLCKIDHDKAHKIINYDERLYICDKHYENYNSYCEECKINLCTLCEGEHKSHKIISLGNIIPNKNELIENNKKLKEYLYLLNHNINIIINILEEVKENMNIFYRINEDIINNYNNENKNRNYEILFNINKIKENNILKELENIINENDIKIKFKYIFDIYCNMNRNINEINIIYNVDDYQIKLFGHDFVERNKNNFKIIINRDEEDLKEYKTFSWFSKKRDKLEIKLKGIKYITNISGMFEGCSSLSSLPDISKLNTNNLTNMSGIFYGCSSLSSLSDISKWNTNNVINMSNIFWGCSSLSSIPDISNWNTNNATNMSGMFYKCSSLTSLPDISNWNTNKVTNMSEMFYECSSLTSLPNISKWNINNVIYMNKMFEECSSLSSLPDIIKWNTNNVASMSRMFGGCSSLTSLPDISNWNTNNLTNMSGMFYECSSLTSLPDISNWNINNVTNMSCIFWGCKESLKIPPKFKNK